MNMRCHQGVLIFILSFVFQTGVFAAPLPTEEEVAGIQRLCGGGNAQIASVKGSVDAAISNWKNAAAGANVEVAKKDLAGALDKVKTDAGLEKVFQIYVDCVNKQIDRWLDREAANAPKSQLQMLDDLAKQFDSGVRQRIQDIHFVASQDQNCNMLRQQLLMMGSPNLDFHSQVQHIGAEADGAFLKRFESDMRARFADKDKSIAVLKSRAIQANCAAV